MMQDWQPMMEAERVGPWVLEANLIIIVLLLGIAALIKYVFFRLDRAMAATALHEMRRVLKPIGRLLFVETAGFRRKRAQMAEFFDTGTEVRERWMPFEPADCMHDRRRPLSA